MANIGTLVFLRLEARQRAIVQLTGSSGTANVTGVGGLTKLATFATDLDTTAKNFVTAHKAAYLAVNVIVTCSGSKLCFKPTLLNATITDPEVTNVTSNLGGTLLFSNTALDPINLIGETSTSLKSAQTMIEVSSKMNPKYSKFKAGRITRSISVSSIGSTDTVNTEYGHEDALQAQNQQVPVNFVLTEYDENGDPVVGAIVISGTTLISNVSDENPDNDKKTFSLDLQITDDMTIDVTT